MAEILFLAHRIPYPPDRGDKIRSFNILKEMGRHARVHLACFADDGEDRKHLPALRLAMGTGLGQAFVEVRPRNWLPAAGALLCGKPVSAALFASGAMRRNVDQLLAERAIDTIFAFSGQMAQFVPDAAGRRFVMDFVDMDSAKFAEYGERGGGPLGWLYRREGRSLLAFEQAVAERADHSLFVSDAEARLFRDRTGLAAARIRAMGNGIDLASYDPAGDFPRLDASRRGAGPLILFTGQMDYRPNVEAVESFACGVMPLIRQHVGEARFAIVGRKPAKAVQQLHGNNGTIVIGAVDDVRSWLAAADVVVAPLTIGRGVQNKVLEAMAMAKPVVASPVAFAGIDAMAGRDLLVADGAEDQAAAIRCLLHDPKRAAGLGAAARRRMEAGYSWPARLAPLTDLLGLPTQQAAA